MKILLSSILVVILTSSCSRKKGIEWQEKGKTAHSELPTGFEEPDYPKDNRPTKARIALGKKLFFDPQLSLDGTISCASCHKPEFAFADNSKISAGVQKTLGFRNAPSLTNIAYHPAFMRDGGVTTLEIQVLSPIEDPDEMAFNLKGIIERLEKDSSYLAMFQAAYQRKPAPFSITRAIAAYERTLISGNSSFDHFLRGDSNAINTAAKHGYDLFKSKKLACSQCHSGLHFTGFAYENNGLYKHYTDPGRARISINPADSGKFKVPSLRNIALTAPYMHDGSLQTLEEVIDHYAAGGKKHINQSRHIKGFSLTSTEKANLIAFLHTLTDTAFINPQNHLTKK